jgi:two-component system invasion response regulator UvrY
MKRIRVLVVDDQRRARQSMHALLATADRVAQVREAESGEEALAEIESFAPHLVLMDARMPAMDGLEATRRIMSRWPRIRVIVMSMYPEYQEEARVAGAVAFLAKDEAPGRLLEMIEDLGADWDRQPETA